MWGQGRTRPVRSQPPELKRSAPTTVGVKLRRSWRYTLWLGTAVLMVSLVVMAACPLLFTTGLFTLLGFLSDDGSGLFTMGPAQMYSGFKLALLSIWLVGLLAIWSWPMRTQTSSENV